MKLFIGQIYSILHNVNIHLTNPGSIGFVTLYLYPGKVFKLPYKPTITFPMMPPNY